MSTIENTSAMKIGKIPLHRRIAEIMQEKGDAYSIRSFSTLIGVSRETLRLMLVGQRPISPSELERIALGLGLKVERLKQLDTYKLEEELTSLLHANKRTKIMLLRAETLANELVEKAVGALERGTSLNNLGRVKFLQQYYETAHEIWLQALTYAEKAHAESGHSNLLHHVTANLLLSYTTRKEYSHIESIIKIVKQMFPDDPEKLAFAEYANMKLNEHRDEIEKALNHAYESLQLFEQTNKINQIGMACVNVAHYEYKMKNFTASATFLERAVRLFQGSVGYQLEAVKEYVKSLLRLKNNETALKLIGEYLPLTKEHPEIEAKLLIFRSVALDDPSYAINIVNNTAITYGTRCLACKYLMTYYKSKGDSVLFMRYYEMEQMLSNNKNNYLDEEDW